MVPWAHRSLLANGISIGSAVSAGLTGVDLSNARLSRPRLVTHYSISLHTAAEAWTVLHQDGLAKVGF